MVNPVPMVASTAKASGGGLFLIFRSLWKYKFIILTIFALFIIMWSAIVESWEEKSTEPLFREVGGRLFLIDKTIQNTVEGSHGDMGYRNSARFIADVLAQVWVLGFVIYAFSILVSWTPISNDSEKFRNWLLAVVIVYLLMTGYCLTYKDTFEKSNKECFSFFPGVRSLLGLDLDDNVILGDLKDFFDRRLQTDNLPVGFNVSAHNSSDSIYNLDNISRNG